MIAVESLLLFVLLPALLAAIYLALASWIGRILRRSSRE